MTANTLHTYKSATVIISVIFTPVAAHADWWTWLFGPKDYEECAENAAREAKSKEALNILLYSCDSKFRGRRKPTGGYTFYDDRQDRGFDIKGPNPTPAELEHIERQYSAYITLKTKNERMRQEELQQSQAEQDRLAAIRELELRQEAVARQREAERRAAEMQQRQQIALRKIAVTSTNIECSFSSISNNICGPYKLTIGLRNQSTETISAISLGWVFLPQNDHSCPTSLPAKNRADVKLAPNDSTVLNIDGYDAPSSTQFHYCVRVTGAEIAPQR
jgi:hypothetical protein